MGLVGGIPFMLINGVHGDTGVIGGIFFVLTNAAVYYGLIALSVKVTKRLRRRSNPNSLG
jgi:hypothetical protein